MPTDRRPPRLTLAQLFVVTVLCVTALVGATFYGFIELSRRSIVERSLALGDEEARGVAQRLSLDLDVAKNSVEDLERDTRFGILSPSDLREVEAHLFSVLLNNPTLSDATFTRATWRDYDPSGDAVLEPGDIWQISLFRPASSEPDHVDTRRVTFEKDGVVAEVRTRSPGASLLAGSFRREGGVPSPTAHATFRTTASEGSAGTAIWSDLAYSELDAVGSRDGRRVVMTVQKAVEDRPGHFAGVIRVGLLGATIDGLQGLGVGGSGSDARFVFLCDAQGRLVSRLDRTDPVALFGDDLRIASKRLAPPVAAALSSHALAQLSSERPRQDETLDVGGRRYLAAFRSLPETQDWAVAVVVPEAHYTRDLHALRNRFFVALLLVTALVMIGGTVVVREVARGLGRIGFETAKMRAFDFAPSSTQTPFRDVSDVVDELERAKTAMRALGKYVPVDLVRTLYASNREPVLGGELLEISILFTDIRGFTELSERLSPNALAHALGQYLGAMTQAIRENCGTIDKFIGDAVMAFWNAPSPLPDHPRRACAAALACIAGTRRLYDSPQWVAGPPLFTRFGLHKDHVLVGHFGAPDRFSYTALGDGVNLAARLEGLCKHYDVAALASEAIVSAVHDSFAFRLVDKVAVKGKTEAVRVYELLGARGECDDRSELARAYEGALQAYFERDFARAIALLRRIEDDGRRADGPTRVLLERCRAMMEDPPPEEWNGVYVATSK